MRLILAILLVLTQAPSAHSVKQTLTFPPNTATCTGGAANDEHLHPAIITCTGHKNRWRCCSTGLHDAFFRIHHVRIACSEECTLEYHLDFTPLAVFTIGFCATILAGAFLAVAMYLAVLKMVGQYGDAEHAESERCLGLRRPGYGSFGGRLYCLGHFSESLKSLLDYDVDDSELPPRLEREEEAKEEDRVDWVAERIYFG